MFRTAPQTFDRKSFLETTGDVKTPVAFQVGQVKVLHSTLAEHRVIYYETGILPHQVSFLDDSKSSITVVVDGSELEKAGYTVESFKKAVELATTAEAVIAAVDSGEGEQDG